MTDDDVSELAFLRKLIELMDEHDIDVQFMRRNGVTSAAIGCNDTFFWGCADAEEVTPETIDALESALAEMREASKPWLREQDIPNKAYMESGSSTFGDVLYCARARKMRPQGAMYKHMRPYMRPLFNACGPERETGLGNPEPSE
jgi:hypothetical protein